MSLDQESEQMKYKALLKECQRRIIRKEANNKEFEELYMKVLKSKWRAHGGWALQPPTDATQLS